MSSEQLDIQTKLLHPHSEHPMNSHVFPIFQSSTFVFNSTQHGADLFMGKGEGYIYSRLGNPTVEVYEEMVRDLEGAAGALAFGSGMAAITASIFPFLQSGDHVVAGDTLYGGTVSLLEKWAPRYGIQVSFVDTSIVDEVKKAWKDNTKMVYLETPGNPTCKVSDIITISAICKEKGAKLVVDATFTSLYYLKPPDLRADISLHSITKYMNGHGDVVGGVSSSKTIEDYKTMRSFRKDVGSVIAPMDAFLCIRGLKTLPMRMEIHMQNGIKVAKFLEGHPKVKIVHHPWLESFKGHDIAVKQMKGCGSTFSFEMESFEAAKKLLEGLKVISLAVSLGTLDTLIEHPASTTHASVPEDLIKKQGLTKELIRISVGVEKIDDIIADLKQALEKL